MKVKKALAAAAFIATAFASTANAEGASFWGYNSWHAGKSSAVCINKHPEKFTDEYGHEYYGCEIRIKPGGGYKTPERWYVFQSGTTEDPKLWYKSEDGSWKVLHDDVSPSNRNFRAVVHVPQRYTNEAASKEIVLMAGYYQRSYKKEYWHTIDQYETSDPNLTDATYLEVAPDGSMTCVYK